MAGYKIFRLIIVIVTTLALTFNAVILPAAALEVGSVNETGCIAASYIWLRSDTEQ